MYNMKNKLPCLCLSIISNCIQTLSHCRCGSKRRHAGVADTRLVSHSHTCITPSLILLLVMPSESKLHFPQCSLFSVVKGLSVSLPTLLLSGSLSAVDRKQQLNAVKMSVFLLCKLTETLESDSYRETIVTAPSKVLLNVIKFLLFISCLYYAP